MEPLQVTYNFQSLEQMIRDTLRFREEYLSNQLEVDYQLLIGINNFQAIFVIK